MEAKYEMETSKGKKQRMPKGNKTYGISIEDKMREKKANYKLTNLSR